MIFLWNHHWFPSLKYPLIITICRSVNNYFNEFFASFLFLIFGIQFFKYVLLSTIRFLHLSLSLSLWYSLLFLSPMFVPSFHSICLSFFLSSSFPTLSLSSVFLPSHRLLQILISSSLPSSVLLIFFVFLSPHLSCSIFLSLVRLTVSPSVSSRFSLSLHPCISFYIYLFHFTLSVSMFPSLCSFNFSLPPRFIFSSVTFSLKPSVSLPFPVFFQPSLLFSSLPKTKSLSIIIVCIFFKSFLRCLQ